MPKPPNNRINMLVSADEKQIIIVSVYSIVIILSQTAAMRRCLSYRDVRVTKRRKKFALYSQKCRAFLAPHIHPVFGST